MSKSEGNPKLQTGVIKERWQDYSSFVEER